jgi:hypothetical protein
LSEAHQSLEKKVKLLESQSEELKSSLVKANELLVQLQKELEQKSEEVSNLNGRVQDLIQSIHSDKKDSVEVEKVQEPVVPVVEEHVVPVVEEPVVPVVEALDPILEVVEEEEVAIVEPEEEEEEAIVICEPEVQQQEEQKPPQLGKQVSIAIKCDQEDSEDDIELSRIGAHFVIKGTRVVLNMDDGNAIGYLDENGQLVRVNSDEVKKVCLLHRISFSA